MGVIATTKVVTSSDSRNRPKTAQPRNREWVSIKYKITELEFQTMHLKNRILRHQDSSPTSINKAFDELVKGAQIMVHLATLLKGEVKILQEANQAKRRREIKKKRRINQDGSLTIKEGKELVRSTQTQQCCDN
jgi:spore germination protein GerM